MVRGSGSVPASQEQQKDELAVVRQQKQIVGKLEKIKTDQENRVRALERDSADADRKAGLVEANAEHVDAAIDATFPLHPTPHPPEIT